MSLRVHVLFPPDRLALDDLAAQLDASVQLAVGTDLPSTADFEVLVAGRPTPEWLAASPQLRALIIPWAGLPEQTQDLLRDFPHVTVHNLHHNAAQTAEMAIALLLAAARFILPADRQLRWGDWTIRHDPPPVLILDGKTALILGYGAIGQRVGRVCQALGMSILAVRRNPSGPAPGDVLAEIHPLTDLRGLFPRADAVIITLPLTEETRGLIGAQELALLPSCAVLVNVGRGAIVDEAALYDSLNSRQLLAAGLDVWYQYPEDEAGRTGTWPSSFPFHELDNVVMSPHRGGAFGSDYTEKARVTQLARLLNAAARGEPIPNRLDLFVGY